jgi:hypothetical protein
MASQPPPPDEIPADTPIDIPVPSPTDPEPYAPSDPGHAGLNHDMSFRRNWNDMSLDRKKVMKSQPSPG